MARPEDDDCAGPCRRVLRMTVILVPGSLLFSGGGSAAPYSSAGSRDQVEVLLACFHCVNGFFGAVVVDENNELDDAPVSVESKDKNALRVLIVERAREDRRPTAVTMSSSGMPCLRAE